MQARQTNHVRIQLRMPPKLHERLVDFSNRNDCSLNSAINTAVDTGLERIESAEVIDTKPHTINLSAITPFIKNLLEEHAQRNKRSIDDEISARLAKSFTIYGGQEALANATTEDLLRELSLRMKGMTVNISPVNDDV